MWREGATELLSLLTFLMEILEVVNFWPLTHELFATEITCQHKHGGQFFDHELQV